MRTIDQYIDKYWLPVTKGGNGGDAAANLGRWATLCALTYKFLRPAHFDNEVALAYVTESYRRGLKNIQPLPGLLVRHPLPGPEELDKKWNDPSDCSRDQLRINWIAMSLLGMNEDLSQFFSRHVLRFWKYQNWDFSTPEDISIWIRCGKVKWLWPVLLLTDWFTVLQSVINCVRLQINDDDVADSLNHDCIGAFNYCVMDTPVSKLARWIDRRRPFKPWSGAVAGHRIMRPWHRYHREQPTNPDGESPPLDYVALEPLGKVHGFFLG